MTYNITISLFENGKVFKFFNTAKSKEVTINDYLQLTPDQYLLTDHRRIRADNLTLNDSTYNVFSDSYIPIYSSFNVA